MLFDRAESPTPPWDGFVHPDFTAVADALRRQLTAYPGGAAVCVYQHGRCVVDLWGGYRDRAGTPWTRDTMAPSFSTTKGVASTLLHIMVDRGLLDYDDRVAKFWPEFAQAGKQAITVRHVLAHQSGLYHIRQMIDHADRMLDWDHMIHAIERATPLHPPGAHTGYHGLTYGYLVGEILRRVTHRPFPRLVHEELVAPLGLDGMYIGAPKRALPRAAQLIWPKHSPAGPHIPFGLDAAAPSRLVQSGAAALHFLLRLGGIEFDLESILDGLAPRGISQFDFGTERVLRASIPAANGLFTARSLARMYAALAGGGALNGTRLLSRRTLMRATQVQGRTAGRMVIPWEMRWRLGYHGVATTRGVPRHAFGHFGYGGSGGWADPRRNLAVGLIVNSGIGTPFGDMRILRVSGAALVSASQSRRNRRASVTPISVARPLRAAAR